MRKKVSIAAIAKKMTTLIFVFCFTALISHAEVNPNSAVLSNVEIKSSDNGYSIVLKSDKAAQVRKVVESQDEIYLDLEGMIPSESVGTVYNDVPEVGSVIIQPLGDNSTRILMQGRNIAASNVSFEPLTPLNTDTALQADTTPKEQIDLNAPVQTYAPVYDRSDVYEDNEPESMFKTAGTLAVSAARDSLPLVKKIIKYILRLDKKYLAFGSMFFLIILLGLKAMQPSKDNEIKVGLSQSLKEKELEMRDELSLNNSLTALENRKLPVSEKSVPSINYGIKSYQNSQRNPYTSQISGLPMKRISQASAVHNKNIIAKRPPNNMAANSNMISRPIAPKKAPIPTSQQARTAAPSSRGAVKNIDGMKFLESMAQIYERNGREDLANELKSNIKKVQYTR